MRAILTVESSPSTWGIHGLSNTAKALPEGLWYPLSDQPGHVDSVQKVQSPVDGSMGYLNFCYGVENGIQLICLDGLMQIRDAARNYLVVNHWPVWQGLLREAGIDLPKSSQSGKEFPRASVQYRWEFSELGLGQAIDVIANLEQQAATYSVSLGVRGRETYSRSSLTEKSELESDLKAWHEIRGMELL